MHSSSPSKSRLTCRTRLAFLVAAAPGSLAAAQIPSATFHLTASLPGAARSIAVADFNGDGMVDIISNNGAMYLGRPDDPGQFTGPSPAEGVTVTDTVHAADLDLDGDVDLIGLDMASEDVLTWWLNQGDATFVAAGSHGRHSNFATGLDIAVADFNADGALDMILPADSQLLLLQGDGLGGFSAPTPIFDTNDKFSAFFGIVLVDNGGDGAPDIIACDLYGAVYHLRPSGEGFTVTTLFYEPDRACAFVRTADFDLDGDEDLVVTLIEPEVLFFENIGGEFALSLRKPVGAGLADPWKVAVGDFNLDGRPDAAYSATQLGAVRVLRNETTTGGFAFSDPASVAPSGFPWDVHTADIDNDGRLDIIATDAGAAHTVLVIRNSTIRTQTADFDLWPDGLIDKFDLAVFLHEWGTRGSTADFDGDGVVSGADFGMLLGMM